MEGPSDIKSIIKQALDNGHTKEEITEFMKKQGFSDSEISNAFPEDTPTDAIQDASQIDYVPKSVKEEPIQPTQAPKVSAASSSVAVAAGGISMTMIAIVAVIAVVGVGSYFAFFNGSSGDGGTMSNWDSLSPDAKIALLETLPSSIESELDDLGCTLDDYMEDGRYFKYELTCNGHNISVSLGYYFDIPEEIQGIIDNRESTFNKVADNQYWDTYDSGESYGDYSFTSRWVSPFDGEADEYYTFVLNGEMTIESESGGDGFDDLRAVTGMFDNQLSSLGGSTISPGPAGGPTNQFVFPTAHTPGSWCVERPEWNHPAFGSPEIVGIAQDGTYAGYCHYVYNVGGGAKIHGFSDLSLTEQHMMIEYPDGSIDQWDANLETGVVTGPGI